MVDINWFLFQWSIGFEKSISGTPISFILETKMIVNDHYITLGFGETKRNEKEEKLCKTAQGYIVLFVFLKVAKNMTENSKNGFSYLACNQLGS